MTAGYSLTPLAEGDLDDTWDYVADRFGFDVADGMASPSTATYVTPR